MKKHQVKQTTERRISASLRIALVLLLVSFLLLFLVSVVQIAAGRRTRSS